MEKGGNRVGAAGLEQGWIKVGVGLEQGWSRVGEGWSRVGARLK